MYSLGLLFGCNSVKKDVANGYTSGTVVQSSVENDCVYTIKVTNINTESVYFDPINLENEFMNNNMKVHFKYRLLKMQNRCDNANPISITEIKKV